MLYGWITLACFAYVAIVAHIPRSNTGIKGPCARRVLFPPHFDPDYRAEVFGGESNSIREIECKNWRAIY
jgi:hypothetical protein